MGIVLTMILVIAGIVVFSIISFGGGDSNTDFNKRYTEYNDGWIMTIDGESQEVTFPVKARTGSDGLILLSKVLPDNIPEYSAIAMRNYHQVMEVTVEGNLIYTYPTDASGNFTILSDAWSIIKLEPEYASKTIEIKLRNITGMPFDGYISNTYYGDDNSILQFLRSDARLPFTTGAIMMILGAFLVIVSFLYRKTIPQTHNIPMGMAIIFFGVWLANRSKIPYFSSSNGRIFFMSIMALLLIPPFLFLFGYFKKESHRNISLAGFTISLAYALFILISSSFVNYNAEVICMVAYGLCFLAMLHDAIMLFMASFGKEARFRSKNELMLDRAELMATVIFPIAVLVEVIFYSDMLWTEISMFYRTFVLIFVIVYVATFFLRVYLVAEERDAISEKLEESQLELMMGQIQPHFIFNTLSSIRTLVKVEPDTAYNMLYDFSKYLRANVDNVTNLDGIPFSAEVEHIKSYVNIEQVRYGDKLTMEYEIGPDDFTVPPLSIQPLVENAIKHGVTKKVEGGTVILRSYAHGTYNVVEVDDSGVGINLDAAQALFSIHAGSDAKMGMESKQVAVNAMNNLIDHLTLLDEAGNPIEMTGPIVKESEDNSDHKSAGMMNIMLRLREMSNAQIEIRSQIGRGTNIKVLFPID